MTTDLPFPSPPPFFHFLFPIIPIAVGNVGSSLDLLCRSTGQDQDQDQDQWTTYYVSTDNPAPTFYIYARLHHIPAVDARSRLSIVCLSCIIETQSRHPMVGLRELASLLARFQPPTSHPVCVLTIVPHVLAPEDGVHEKPSIRPSSIRSTSRQRRRQPSGVLPQLALSSTLIPLLQSPPRRLCYSKRDLPREPTLHDGICRRFWLSILFDIEAVMARTWTEQAGCPRAIDILCSPEQAGSARLLSPSPRAECLPQDRVPTIISTVLASSLDTMAAGYPTLRSRLNLVLITALWEKYTTVATGVTGFLSLGFSTHRVICFNCRRHLAPASSPCLPYHVAGFPLEPLRWGRWILRLLPGEKEPGPVCDGCLSILLSVGPRPGSITCQFGAHDSDDTPLVASPSRRVETSQTTSLTWGPKGPHPQISRAGHPAPMFSFLFHELARCLAAYEPLDPRRRRLRHTFSSFPFAHLVCLVALGQDTVVLPSVLDCSAPALKLRAAIDARGPGWASIWGPLLPAGHGGSFSSCFDTAILPSSTSEPINALAPTSQLGI
ncbi:hypothetical protein ACRALDRAFT_2018308 [Sodiomyces alcalophilus JCM 7366]|uniref:uncharacterized protein n=1 Tax=Sodiomyces alcalophilus JCM 7366 TaxID=591952 RepID=UPI0039B4422E